MTIDARIIGVESRMDNIRQTQRALGVPDTHIFLDTERKGVIWNAKRAWLHPTDATHILVLQDDVELCDGFMDICRRIVEAQPDKVISLFPFQFQRDDSLLCGSADKLPTPYVEALPISGLGVILPTKYVEECMASIPPYFVTDNDDTAIQEWAKSAGVQCITTLPAILQHIGDDSEIYRGAAPRRTAFYEQKPVGANWENREVLPWREVYREQPLSDVSLNLEIADTVFELRTKGVKSLVRGFFLQFITEKPAAVTLVVTDEWDPGNYRENLRQRLAEHLIARDILPIYARTVAIDGRALLLVGEKKHEAVYRLSQRLQGRAAVLMGSVQALSLCQRAVAPVAGDSVAGQNLTAHATPFTDRYPWEANPTALAQAEITRILILPQDVAFLSSESFDPESLFTEESSAELLPELIRALILPAGLPLRLKALSLAGQIAQLPVYELRCTISQEAVSLSYAVLNRHEI